VQTVNPGVSEQVTEANFRVNS